MSRRRPSPAAARRRRLPLLIEAMEARRLLATLSGGVLEIVGTTAVEHVTVGVDGADLVVTTNGSVQRFARAEATSIVARLGNGNDSIALDDDVTIDASLLGEAGSDTLRGGAGTDTIDGGSGDDTVTYAGRAASVSATLKLSTLDIYDGGTLTGKAMVGSGTGGAEGDEYTNVETLVGGDGDDAIVMSAFEGTGFMSGVFVIRAEGGGGDDTITTDPGTTLTGTDLRFAADGGAGNDTIGYADLSRSFRQTTLAGGAGDDTLHGGVFLDVLLGGAGDDLIHSNGGGSNGENPNVPLGDSLDGSAGNDTLLGGSGDDTLDGGEGNDVLDGGGGTDVVTYAGRGDPITASILTEFGYPSDEPVEGEPYAPLFTTRGGGGAGDAELDTYENVESLVGGNGDDQLALEARLGSGASAPASTFRTALDGGPGDDRFTLSSATDGGAPAAAFVQHAVGGAGDDRFDFIFNTAGATTLVGGDGDDTFSTPSDDSFATIDAGAGVDTVIFNSNLSIYGAYTLAAGLENFTNTISAGDVIGNDLPNLITVAGAGVVDGGGGNDTLTNVGGATARLRGGSGNDTLRAGSGGDELEGGSGNDRLFGGAGNDALLGGGGNDRLEGGAGSDTINGEAGDDSLFGGDGNDSLLGGSGNDAIDPGLGDDSAHGGDGADALVYTGRADAIVGNVLAALAGGVVRAVATAAGAAGDRDVGEFVEVLTGGDGNDTLDALVEPGTWALAGLFRPPIIVNGGDGDDRLTLTGVAARSSDPDAAIVRTVTQLAFGGDGDDALFAARVDPAHARLIGEAGDDDFAYDGPDGSAAIDGGAGVDALLFRRARLRDADGDAVGPAASQVELVMPDGLEDVTVESEAFASVTGNDAGNRITVRTRRANVKVIGGAGGDTIVLRSEGGIAQATTDAGDGDDFVDSADFIDTIRGGAGNDRLYGGGESDRIYGGDGDDRISGSGGKDTIRGDDGRDTLNGNTGSDRLYGGPGNDRLSGGDDQDTLDGEGGRDSLVGGAGRDIGKRAKTDRMFTQIEELL